MRNLFFLAIPIIPVKATKDTKTPRINTIVIESRWPKNLHITSALINIQLDIVTAVTPASLINSEIKSFSSLNL